MVSEDEYRGEIDDGSDDEEVPILVNVDENNDGDNQDAAPQLVALNDEKPPPTATTNNPLPPVPVTILSGFLGSGKTTLIQHILQSPDHHKRIAVIENEFGGGDEGLSVESMIARDGANQDSLSDLIELPNGCICCTVKDSLVSTLENLLEKRNDLDYILIEASGMANPGPIASLFWLDDALESRLKLDGVVTLVDALYVQQQLEQTEEAAQQIAYADRILLNKVDLVEGGNTDDLMHLIRTIHPTAPIRPTTYSQIPDLDWILDANCFDVDRAKEVDLALSRVEEAHDHHHDCTDVSCSTCAHATPSPTQHQHTAAVGTTALVQKGSVDLSRMNTWLASLLWPNQDEQNSVLKARLEETDSNKQQVASSTEMQIFRIKGILSANHGDDVDVEEQDYVNDCGLDSRRFIVQAVFDLWEIHPASDDLCWDRPLNGEEAPLERSCKLVVIGRCLREKELKEGFLSCFIEETS